MVNPAGRAVPRHSVDSLCAFVRLCQRLWWPDGSRCFRQANRELRCESGTAPPLYSGDLRSRKTWPGGEASRIRAIVVRIRPEASANRREGMRLSESVSQKTYQVLGACRTARAGWRARPQSRSVAKH